MLFNNIAWVTANNFERAAGCTSKKWRDMLRVLQVVGNKEDTPQSLREWAAEKHITLPDPDEELAIKDSIIPYEDDSVPLDGVGPWPRAPLVEGFIAVEHPTLGEGAGAGGGEQGNLPGRCWLILSRAVETLLLGVHKGSACPPS